MMGFFSGCQAMVGMCQIRPCHYFPFLSVHFYIKQTKAICASRLQNNQILQNLKEKKKKKNHVTAIGVVTCQHHCSDQKGTIEHGLFGIDIIKKKRKEKNRQNKIHQENKLKILIYNIKIIKLRVMFKISLRKLIS